MEHEVRGEGPQVPPGSIHTCRRVVAHVWAPYPFVHTLYTIPRASRTTLQGLRLGSQCVMLDYARSDSVKERQRKETAQATGRPYRHRVRMRCVSGVSGVSCVLRESASG